MKPPMSSIRSFCLCFFSELGWNPASCNKLRMEERLLVDRVSFGLAVVVGLVLILLRLLCGLFNLMSYDDVEVEDMEWNEELKAFTYPCPCGDLFMITKEDLKMGEEIARCPSCSLYITVIYNQEDFQRKDTKCKNTPENISTEKGGTVIVVA